MEKKIDAVLSSIKVSTERFKSIEDMKITNIEDKFDLYESRFLTIDRRLAQQEEKINDLTNELDNIANLSDFNEIRDRVKYLEKIAEDARREALRQKSYNERLNLLVHGVKELPNIVWRNKLQTQTKLYEVFKEGPGIDLNFIKLVDIHRLLQRPVYDNQHKAITHPIIIKLQNALDKGRIMRNLDKLKMYNSKRQEKETPDSSTTFLGAYASNQCLKAKIFVTELMPKDFYE